MQKEAVRKGRGTLHRCSASRQLKPNATQKLTFDRRQRLAACACCPPLDHILAFLLAHTMPARILFDGDWGGLALVLVLVLRRHSVAGKACRPPMFSDAAFH